MPSAMCRLTNLKFAALTVALAAVASLALPGSVIAQGTSVLTLLPTDGRILSTGENTGALSSSDYVDLDDNYLEGWTLTGVAGQEVTIDLIATAFDPRLYVTGPGMAETMYDDDSGGGCNSRITLTFLESGDFTVAATSLGSRQTGTYTLVVSDDPPDTPTYSCGDPDPSVLGSLPTDDRTLELGSVEFGQLTSAAPTVENGRPAQAWILMGEAGQSVSITLESDAFDAYLYVLGPGLDSPMSDDDSAGELNSKIDFVMPTDGPYIVVASALGSGSTGSYTLSVGEPLDPMTITPNGSIALGGVVNGTLSGLDDEILDGRPGQIWAFEGTAGQRIAIELISDDFDAYLYLMGPGYTTPLSDDDSAGELNSRITATLPETGSYRIVAAALSSGSTGAYQLTLESR